MVIFFLKLVIAKSVFLRITTGRVFFKRAWVFGFAYKRISSSRQYLHTSHEHNQHTINRYITNWRFGNLKTNGDKTKYVINNINIDIGIHMIQRTVINIIISNITNYWFSWIVWILIYLNPHLNTERYSLLIMICRNESNSNSSWTTCDDACLYSMYDNNDSKFFIVVHVEVVRFELSKIHMKR